MVKSIAVPADARNIANGRMTLLEPGQGIAREQMARLRKQFWGRGLKTEGPFSDTSGSVAWLSDVVLTHAVIDKNSVLEALRSVLIPVNFPGADKPKLNIPFTDKKRSAWAGIPLDNAGAIAAVEPVACERGLYKTRIVDMQELTVLAVGVLRVLQVETFFGVLHHSDPAGEKERTPCMIMPEKGHRIRVEAVLPNSAMDELAGRATALEVLDDDALLSIMRLKYAFLRAKALMREAVPGMCEKSELHAIQAGHLLGSANTLWTIPEAILEDEEVREAIPGFESSREVAEREYAHPIICAACHENSAIEEIAGNAGDRVRQARRQLSHGDVLRISSFFDGEKGMALEARMDAYMLLAGIMNLHLHPERGCSELADSVAAIF